MITQEEYAQRRARLFDALPKNSLAFISAASEQTRNSDVHYPFRQNSDFWYLTGFLEPDAVLVLLKTDECKTYFFCRDKDPKREQWEGRRMGPMIAKATYKFDGAFTIDALSAKSKVLRLPSMACYHTDISSNLVRELKLVNRQPLGPLLHPQRVIKSNAEVALMQTAATLSVEAHRAAMRACKPGINEYHLEADMLHSIMQKGTREMAYPSIVGSGDNATILHYTDNNQELQAGALVLIDAGAEWHGYASDITRTFPVSGHFSKEQRAIYELVLAAQEAGIACIRPGVAYDQIQSEINEVITEGLVELGILKGDIDQLVHSKSHLPYTVHGAGHWLGLDVHDVGAYYEDKEKTVSRPLEPGMVLTVEPGLYFLPGMPNVDRRWHGIGVRIEDDILVTEEGHHVLTGALEKTVDAIEELCQSQ